MHRKIISKSKKILGRINFYFAILLIILLAIIFFIGIGFWNINGISYNRENLINGIGNEKEEPIVPSVPPLDKVDYDLRLNKLANIPVVVPVVNKDGTVPLPTAAENTQIKKPNLWPVVTPYPNDGAILPFKRVIAYYGNLYSTKMGALGEYPETEMLSRLIAEVKKWNDADPATPALPALHYIVVTAQGSKGADGKYRFRMPDKEIDKVIEMAKKIDAIVFLDIQVALSNLQIEVPRLEKYLKMPQVHLGIDPEFSMKTGARPGTVVGTFDAADINFTAEYLSKIVKENNLTPKILVVHRYTQKMVTNYKIIKPLPEVQIVMHMDGWGGAAKKMNTYKQFIYKEPVQFAGFKLFYKNDIFDKGTVLMTPEQLLKLSPQPIYIQYQ
jgi:hypothetical protein